MEQPNLFQYRAEQREKKLLLEEKIESASKERFVMFKTMEKEKLNTPEWRSQNANITILTKEIKKLRQKWTVLDKSY